MCILKAWELAPLTLPSISSRAPHETHLPASEQDHVILFDRRRELHGSSGGGSRASSCSPRSGGLLATRGTGSHHLSSCVSVRWSPSGPFGRGYQDWAGFYSSAARSSDLTQAAAFRVSDPTSGRRTCKGWPTPAVGAKISRSSHLGPGRPGKGVLCATAIQRNSHDHAMNTQLSTTQARLPTAPPTYVV